MRNGAPFQETGQPGVHPSSRVARAAFFSFAALALAASLLCAGPPPARALTDLDYDYLLNRSKDFAQAEELLRDSWARLKDRSSPERFATLVSAQRQWLSKERDQEAKKYFDQGQPLEEAYARVSRERAAWLDAIESSKEKAAFQEDSGRAAAISCLSGDCRNGQGVAEYADGSRYEGKFVDGRRSGHGTLDLKNGTRYTGGFSDDAMTGIFKIDYPNGNSYVGDLKNGKLDGHGIYAWADGKQYGGAFHDNAASGQGTMIYPDGSQYEGEFRQWGINGEGTKTDASGHAVHGVWEGGVLVRETPAPVAKTEPGTAPVAQMKPEPVSAAPVASVEAAKPGPNPKWGYIDKTGKIVIPPQFDDAFSFSHGMAIVNVKGRKGLIDITGRTLLEPKYREIWIEEDGLISVQDQRLNWSLLRSDTTPIFNDVFGNRLVYSEGIIWVPTPPSGKPVSFSAYYATGQRVFTLPAQETHAFNEGLAAVLIPETGWGFVDREGSFVITPQYHAVDDFHDGMAEYSEDGNDWGYLDTDGKMAIFTGPQHGARFENGRSTIRDYLRREILMDKQGRQLSNSYSYIHRFHEGIAVVDTGSKYGAIDATGREVIPPTKIWLDGFHEGLAAAQSEDGALGYVDKTGTMVIKVDAEQLREFTNGLAPAKSGGKWGLLNTKGEWVLRPTSEVYPFTSDGIWGFGDKRKIGFMDSSGHVFVDAIFINTKGFQEGLAAVEMNTASGPDADCGDENEKFINHVMEFPAHCGPFDLVERIHGLAEEVCGPLLRLKIQTFGTCSYGDMPFTEDDYIWVKASDCTKYY